MEPFPLSLLNDFLYCARRAALKQIEGVRGENAHTLIGDITHAKADLPGYEVARGVTVLRATPVWSVRLGLSGRCDIVEKHGPDNYLPVEYKKGRRRAFQNDDVQLCAQALCLEEMLNVHIPSGAIFHAASNRRREVPFDLELRSTTEKMVSTLRALVESNLVPQAEIKPLCEGCSLKGVCLPELTHGSKRCLQASQLFNP